MRRAVDVVDEVGHQPGHHLMRRRDELGIQRMPRRATDPVLDPAQAAMRVAWQQRGVEPDDVLDRHLLRRRQGLRGLTQDRDVVRDEPRLVAESPHRLVLCQLGEGDLLRRRRDALDHRAGDRLGSHQEPGQPVQVTGAGPRREASDRSFDAGERGSEFTVDRERESGQRIRQIGAVGAAPPLAARNTGLHARLPRPIEPGTHDWYPFIHALVVQLSDSKP